MFNHRKTCKVDLILNNDCTKRARTYIFRKPHVQKILSVHIGPISAEGISGNFGWTGKDLRVFPEVSGIVRGLGRDAYTGRSVSKYLWSRYGPKSFIRIGEKNWFYNMVHYNTVFNMTRVQRCIQKIYKLLTAGYTFVL